MQKDEIIQLIRLKHKYTRMNHRVGPSEQLKAEINRLQKEIKREISKYREEKKKHFTTELSNAYQEDKEILGTPSN